MIGPTMSVHTQRWAAALRERGLHVSILSPSPLPVPLPPTLTGLPIWTFPVGRPGMTRAQRLRSLLSGWAMVPGLLHALAPDIVHLHSLPTPAAVPFLLRLPHLVVSAWGSDVVQRDARKVRWYPLLLARAAALCATSHYLAGVLASYLRQPRPINVIAFGIDITKFRPPPVLVVHTPFRIGCLKRLERIAGQDLLLRAFAQLRAAPDGRLPVLRLGGDGEERPALQQLSTTLGVHDRVQFLGAVPHVGAPEFLRQLDLFAMPSRAESFGVAALEAQACGLPVVATAVGGVTEVIQDGQTGVLVPPEDVHALQYALQQCMDDRATLASMAQAGPAWVRTHYDWARNIDQMLAVYEQVLSGS
ncbi:MAG: glycosyltransferase [Herpetosiphonaceae bacterium]|nr:glycosyltransferase [Herpetosiphonaceae bacterium]